VLCRCRVCIPWPAHSMRSPMRTAWLYQKSRFCFCPRPS
jgi:hypothetical protein